MSDRIKILFKSTTGEIHTIKAVWKILYTTIGYVSSSFAAVTLMKELSGYEMLKVWMENHWIVVVILLGIISLIHNRTKINYCKNVVGSDMQVLISVKDMFSNRAANSYVIPTNTFFRTRMDNEYISPSSVQGRFQLKYFKKKLHVLDKLISEDLGEQGIQGENTTDCFGKTMRYPIGTVAKIDYKKRHYYFVAINDVNEYGKPMNQSIDNIEVALNAVMVAIKSRGHYDNLCIPLLGSGKAAIQEATKEKVFQRIVDFFIEAKDKLACKLIIAISPNDYLNGSIDLSRAGKYLEYRCEFGK